MPRRGLLAPITCNLSSKGHCQILAPGHGRYEPSTRTLRCTEVQSRAVISSIGALGTGQQHECRRRGQDGKRAALVRQAESLGKAKNKRKSSGKWGPRVTLLPSPGPQPRLDPGRAPRRHREGLDFRVSAGPDCCRGLGGEHRQTETGGGQAAP